MLIENEMRNQLIIGDIEAEVKQGRVPIVLTERREHAKVLSELLSERAINNEVLVGAMKKKSRNEVSQRLGTTQVLVATGRFIGERFDLPRLDTRSPSILERSSGSVRRQNTEGIRW
ncbi:hypothetical protein [Vibrio parahaemolyticus]|uniref:Uncharacterized protein n=2 Tax=Vibrio parahaemolyticus TaxID=670 RepID=A0AA46UN45_VIBPH|nr:hypothetical protein [Vibrio parahaemolyticus]UYV28518.1 hypothetical protein M5598_22670 [Vibrio parahaemolyticus]